MAIVMERKISLVIIGLCFISIFSIGANGQSLYVDANIGDLKKIKDSKYIASAVNILRNSNGELISVVKTDATRYLDKPVTDEYLDTLSVIKRGNLNGKNIEMLQIAVEYNYEKCLTEVYQVPGYSDQCNWYHRATVTSLGVNDEKGESYELFRGLNHSYTVKPSDSVTSFWTIIRSD